MTIGEISKATNISEYTLRYYEKKGLIRVKRDSVGRRIYEESDIEWVKFIQRLKDTGMLLKDIKKYSNLRYGGDVTMPERLSMLKKHRKYVLEQQTKWTFVGKGTGKWVYIKSFFPLTKRSRNVSKLRGQPFHGLLKNSVLIFCKFSNQYFPIISPPLSHIF